MRKKNDTLRENLLRCAREVADREGPSAVNIRTIAGMAGVAAGTVYNYFANKEEILLALTQAYWEQALREMQASLTAGSFCGQLEEIFEFLREKIDHFPKAAHGQPWENGRGRTADDRDAAGTGNRSGASLGAG